MQFWRALSGLKYTNQPFGPSKHHYQNLRQVWQMISDICCLLCIILLLWLHAPLLVKNSCIVHLFGNIADDSFTLYLVMVNFSKAAMSWACDYPIIYIESLYWCPDLIDHLGYQTTMMTAIVHHCHHDLGIFQYFCLNLEPCRPETK